MDDVKRLQNACNAVKDDPERHERISKLLEYIYQAYLVDFKSEKFHSRILNGPEVKAIADIRPADNNVEPDEEFREWLAEVGFGLGTVPYKAQLEVDEDLDDIENIRIKLAKHLEQKVGRELNAKATRAVAALYPRYFTTLVSYNTLKEFITKFNIYFPTLKIDHHSSVSRMHWQILDKMAMALGPVSKDKFEELARRMTLPFRLMEQGYLTPEVTAPQNLILYGPPGTGKTYSTTQSALELILGKDKIKDLEPSKLKSLFREYQKKGQIEFVTFHQSYGYEEFVEGLRPVLDEAEGNDVRYQLHDGVFKRIALRAAAEGLKKSTGGQDPDFDYMWDRLVEEIREDSDHKRTVTSKDRKEYVFGKPNPSSIKIFRCERDKKDKLTVFNSAQYASKKNSKELWDQRINFDFGEDPEHLTTTNADEILEVGYHFAPLWIVYKRLWELNQENTPCGEENVVQRALDKDESESFSFSADPIETPQYVLIIDEINRGNVSKILGELITLLETDKRLTADNELILRLPYSPAHRFGVPPNLHILGTMNTADRSIALMDVALRRRFTFEERMPDASILEDELTRKLPDSEPLVTLIVDLFNTLNERIRFLYDRDHQLGHSYFLNVKNLEDLRRVFVDRVIPLLQEYFYGDWYKICTVLGCPYSEEGNNISRNMHPIVKAERFEDVDLLGFNHDEYEDRVDFAVSADFLRGKMNGGVLVRTFFGVLPDKFDKSATRLAELTGSELASDTDEGSEEEPEDN